MFKHLKMKLHGLMETTSKKVFSPAQGQLKILCLAAIAGCSYNALDENLVDCSTSTLALTTQITDSACGLNNGIVTLQVTGGQPPYIYVLNSVEQSDAVFDEIAAGNYQVKVTDQQGCIMEEEVIVNNTDGVFVDSSLLTPGGCLANEGVIEIIAANGVEPYTYRLNNGVDQVSNSFVGLSSGQYLVTVTDASDCQFDLDTFLPSGVSFQQSVSPIIMNSCAITGCHNGTNNLPDFTLFGPVQANAAMIKTRTQSGNMPKTGTLTQNEKNLIACWVDDGALNN